MSGLAPGIAPVPITGLIMNTGAEDVFVAAVDVEITSITAQPGSAVGSCDPTDYVILDTRMPVDRTLAAGRSTAFGGASIGFSDKPAVQDACQRAVVHLLYTVRTDGR
jgi:hypothetical protein